MSIVPSILLLNINSNEKHHLNASEYVIGRGWLNCNDKRISRNHGVLKIISTNTVAVLSTHQNTMFFRKKNDIGVNQIEQNKEVHLFVGDSFGLLVDDFWFAIQPFDNENGEWNEATSSGLKRRTSSDSEPDSTTNKRIKSEPNEFRNDDPRTDCDLNATLPSSNVLPSTSASSLNIPQNEANELANTNRPIKSEPIDSNEIQLAPPIKTEPMSQEDNVDSTNSFTPVTIKTEVGREAANENSGGTTSTARTRQVAPRECCRYGIRCYRRNPLHREQEAHPGDQDYRLPNYPEPPLGAPSCPYLDRCYRRNPEHFKQFTHKTPFSQCGKEGYEATATAPKAPKPTTNTTTNTVTNGNDSESEDDPFATDDDSDADY